MHSPHLCLPQIVLIAFGTTAGLVATLTFIAVVMPFDITKKGHVLGAAAMMFMVSFSSSSLTSFNS